MEYLIRYEDLMDLDKDIEKNAKAWYNGMAPLMKEMKKIAKNEYLDGQMAEGINNYFNTIHGSIQKDIKNLVELHQGNYALFYKQMRKIEGDSFARIEQSELKSIRSDLKKFGKQTEGVESDVQSILREVSDIFTSPSRTGIKHIRSVQKEIRENIKTLDENILTVDNNHYCADFDQTETLMKSLKRLIKECKSKDRSFKTNFTVASLSQLKSWKNVEVATNSVKNDYRLKEAQITRANEEADSVAKSAAEYKKRKWIATGIKAVVGVACVALSVALIVACPGIGLVAAGAIGGAISGCLNKTAEVLTDEYVENGNLKKLNVKKAVKEVAISTVTGAVTGAVSGAIPGASSNACIYDKIGRSVLKEMAKGAAGRATDSSINAVDNVISGKTDIRSALQDVSYDTLNPNEIAKDATSGMIDGAVGELSDKAFDKTRFGDKAINKYAEGTKEYANAKVNSSLVKGTVEDTASGIISREAEKSLDGYTDREALEAAFNPHEVVNDIATGGIKKVGGDVTKTVSIKDTKSALSTSSIKKPGYSAMVK